MCYCRGAVGQTPLWLHGSAFTASDAVLETWDLRRSKCSEQAVVKEESDSSDDQDSTNLDGGIMHVPIEQVYYSQARCSPNFKRGTSLQSTVDSLRRKELVRSDAT